MLAQDLPELAAPLSFETHRLMRQALLLAHEDAANFEEEALDRLEAWTQAAANWHRQRTCQRNARQAWRDLQTLLDEILMSEVLTRVRGALADSHAALHGDDALSTAARRILDGHIRIRDRIWWLLTSGGGSPSDVMIPLDELRRRLASWTDLLLAHVPDADVAARWACDPQRMADFRASSPSRFAAAIPALRLPGFPSRLQMHQHVA